MPGRNGFILTSAVILFIARQEAIAILQGRCMSQDMFVETESGHCPESKLHSRQKWIYSSLRFSTVK